MGIPAVNQSGTFTVSVPSEDLNLWLWANDIDILSYLGNRSVLRCVHPVSFWIIICAVSIRRRA